MRNTDTENAKPALFLQGGDGGKLFGVTTGERLRRLFALAGVSPLPEGRAPEEEKGALIMVRADAVLDQPLAQALITTPGLVLLDTDKGRPVAVHAPAGKAAQAKDILAGGAVPEGFTARRPADLGLNFREKLRKKEPPNAMILTEEDRPDIEWRYFRGTYKGVTDIVTKRVWPRPAFYVTRFLANTFVTPNMVTSVSVVLMLSAYWLFLRGHYGWGLLAGWTMTFLDTVDGKLARTTLRSSKLGNVLDHGMDLIHPPFWYVAWGLGLERAGFSMDARTWWLMIWVIVVGYVLQRVIEGVAARGMGMHIHIWRRIDSYFREITARRNPNLIILTVSVVLGRPDLGLLAVAWWTAICLLLHAVQLWQAIAHVRRTGEFVSWMERE